MEKEIGKERIESPFQSVPKHDTSQVNVGGVGSVTMANDDNTLSISLFFEDDYLTLNFEAIWKFFLGFRLNCDNVIPLLVAFLLDFKRHKLEHEDKQTRQKVVRNIKFRFKPLYYLFSHLDKRVTLIDLKRVMNGGCVMCMIDKEPRDVRDSKFFRLTTKTFRAENTSRFNLVGKFNGDYTYVTAWMKDFNHNVPTETYQNILESSLNNSTTVNNLVSQHKWFCDIKHVVQSDKNLYIFWHPRYHHQYDHAHFHIISHQFSKHLGMNPLDVKAFEFLQHITRSLSKGTDELHDLCDLLHPIRQFYHMCSIGRYALIMAFRLVRDMDVVMARSLNELSKEYLVQVVGSLKYILDEVDMIIADSLSVGKIVLPRSVKYIPLVPFEEIGVEAVCI